MNNWLLKATRVWLPVSIAAVGVVLILVGGERASGEALLPDSPVTAAGLCLVIVAIIVWMINWMFRMSVQSNRDREREEEARVYFDEHGRWPDE